MTRLELYGAKSNLPGSALLLNKTLHRCRDSLLSCHLVIIYIGVVDAGIGRQNDLSA